MNYPDFELRWEQTLEKLEVLLKKKPNLDSILFLIGVQELGKGIRNFSKEEKQDLMHIATCRLLGNAGFYSLEGLDKEGWPIWVNEKKLPFLTLKEQELFLRTQIVDYFSNL